MIDSKELRIGNLAESPTGWIGSVIELKSSFVRLYEKDDLSAYNFGSDLIDPIPITPEWLERLGFELRLPHDVENFVHWNFNGFEIWQHGEGFCHDFHFGGDIKYVHQLQNLFYALTGQELNPKDNA